MSPLQNIAVIGCIALSLTGCNDRTLNVTIPMGTVLYAKLYHIGDSVLGSVLPTEYRSEGFSKAEYAVSQVLVDSDCALGIPLEWSNRLKKHVASSATLSCEGVDQRELQGYVVDEDGEQGLDGVTLGGVVSFVVTQTVSVK
jgi:hypothetical protein